MAASRFYGSNISLPSLDNLFSTEEERQDAKPEKVQNIALSELHPFKDHPFHVRDDEEMEKMVDSIKQYGVMTPAVARPRPEGGYELISGHRRHHGALRAGIETLPCIIRDMDDDTAVILMVDSNCQREHVLPSEKANVDLRQTYQRVENTVEDWSHGMLELRLYWLAESRWNIHRSSGGDGRR